MEIFEEALKIEPNNPHVIIGNIKSTIGIGKEKFNHNLFDESLKYFEKVLTIDKENKEAINGKFDSCIGIAENLLKKQEYETALETI